MIIVFKKILKRRPPKVITNRGVYGKCTASNIYFWLLRPSTVIKLKLRVKIFRAYSYGLLLIIDYNTITISLKKRQDQKIQMICLKTLMKKNKTL